jgi:large subunit ribosomal protein L32
MAKRPTPKKKLSNDRSNSRYASFVFKTKRKLENEVNLIKCSNCGQMRINHHACMECGFYNGRRVIDMEKKIEKITKVKA